MHREYTHALLAMCMSFDEGILFETGDFECCAFVHLSKDDGSKQMTEAEVRREVSSPRRVEASAANAKPLSPHSPPAV